MPGNGVCKRWRALLSFVKREEIQRAQVKVLLRRDLLRHRLPAREQHHLPGHQAGEHSFGQRRPHQAS